MGRNQFGLLAVATALALHGPLSAQEIENGSVVEHTGETGDLIVLRDGLVFWLSTGDDLFEADIVRASYPDMSIVSYNGCVFTLPENEDVPLDDDFCSLTVANAPTMAEVASRNDVTALVSGADAPLMVGGVVLSAGGLAAATNGGNGGTESVASAAAGAEQAGVDP